MSRKIPDFTRKEVRLPEVKLTCPKCQGRISGVEPFRKHVELCRGRAA